MKNGETSNKIEKAARRLTAVLLAALLCCAAPAAAFAQEDPTAPAEEVFFDEEPTPDEEVGESPQQESAERDFSAGLLLTGGHKTYLGGYAGQLFMPERAMTRAETAQMLFNLLAEKPPVSASQFSDVSMEKWYGKPINTLAALGVLNGYKDGTFQPNKSISRAEFVKVICKCFDLEPGTVAFSDVPETHWAHPYITAAVSADWIHGVGNDLFQPDRAIKRSEAVTVMNAALGRLDSEYASDRNLQKFKDVPPSYWAFLAITEAASPPAAPEPEPNNTEFEVGQHVRVLVNGLNLRSGPSTDSSSVGTLNTGDTLTITDVSGLPWLGVKTANGKTGFVHSGYSDHPYVEIFTPGAASGARVSASALTFHQYQTARLDATVSTGLSSMSWTSSDPSVAVVGYTVDYGTGYSQGAMVYGKKPGTATLTFADAEGKTKASCTVTITEPEGVRFGYASENAVIKGREIDLVAITESTRSSVTFQVTAGPTAGEVYTSTTFAAEKRSSSYGLPDNCVRVFRYPITFDTPGTYTVRATADGHTDHCDFQVLVLDSFESSTTTSYSARRASTQMLRVVANFEGSVIEIEDDRSARGNPTVGYGYVAQVNTAFYNTLTPTELWAMLVDQTNRNYGAKVEQFRSQFNIKMSQAQFDALVSFVYNLGPGNLFSDYGFRRAMLNAAAVDVTESSPVAGKVNVEDVDAGGAILYDQTNVDGKKVKAVKSGETVTIINRQIIAEKQQVWYQVRYGEDVGWMPAGYVNIPGAGCDLTYVDSTVLANNLLQWSHAGGGIMEGLVLRRLAECKVFFFANYAEAMHSNSKYRVNSYGFHFPASCKAFDYR